MCLQLSTVRVAGPSSVGAWLCMYTLVMHSTNAVKGPGLAQRVLRRCSCQCVCACAHGLGGACVCIAYDWMRKVLGQR